MAPKIKQFYCRVTVFLFCAMVRHVQRIQCKHQLTFFFKFDSLSPIFCTFSELFIFSSVRNVEEKSYKICVNLLHS